MNREIIKDANGKILGSLEQIGDRTVCKDFYGKVLGYYDAKEDRTKDYYGKVIARGNTVVSFLYRQE